MQTFKEYLEIASKRRDETMHESLVDLLSGATYGSDWIEIIVPKCERNHELVQQWKTADKTEVGDCCEDKWAYVLLNGGTIAVVDHLAIQEDGATREEAKHIVTMETFDNAMEEFAKHKAYTEFLNMDDDMYTCDTLIQCVIFGEPTYA